MVGNWTKPKGCAQAGSETVISKSMPLKVARIHFLCLECCCKSYLTDYRGLSTPSTSVPSTTNGLSGTLTVHVDDFAFTPLLTEIGNPAPLQALYPLRDISLSPASTESLSFVRECVKDCVTSHSECNFSRSFHPKRLLNIAAEQESIKLIEPGKMSVISYIALSYCWGTDQPLKTTKATLSKRQEGIEWYDLPHVVQDAVFIARKLGLQHIWIDALCIIQDDTLDWEQQCQQMAAIYEHAYLVIAAASSSHSNKSFLSAIKNKRPMPVTLNCNRNGQMIAVKIREIIATGMHEDYEANFDSRDPLDNRGWPLQERLLATRLLVFSSTELQWSCNVHTVCEGGHQESPLRGHSIHSLHQPLDIFNFWHIQVKEYSRRQLTLPKDKLPAIAGIATKVHNLIESEYLAGLWKENLVKDLCWERHLGQSVPWGPTSTWRAPSFSWASVEGNIYYNDNGISGDGTYHTEVLAAHCTPASDSSPFGEVADGFVTLRGPLLEASISTHPYAGDNYLWTHLLLTRKWHIPIRADIPLAQTPILPTSGELNGLGDTAGRVAEGGSTPIENARAWILIIGFWNRKSLGTMPEMWVSCIVLGRSSRRCGMFERLGFVNTRWPPPREARPPPTEFLELLPWVFGEEGKTDLTII